MEPVLQMTGKTGIMGLYRRYRHAPLNPLEHLLVYLRLRFSSYQAIERHVPASGEIVDLGCGFGMLAVYLALMSEARHITGIDISHRRLNVAKFISADIHNVAFEYFDLLQYNFDAALASGRPSTLKERVEEIIVRKRGGRHKCQYL